MKQNIMVVKGRKATGRKPKEGYYAHEYFQVIYVLIAPDPDNHKGNGRFEAWDTWLNLN